MPTIQADKAVISAGSSVDLRVSCSGETFLEFVASALLPRPYTKSFGTLGNVTTDTVKVVAPGKYTISLICYQGIGILKTAVTAVAVHR